MTARNSIVVFGALILAGAVRPLGAWAKGPGTTGANFLKIPAGPRQVGMGDQGVALADDTFTLYHNPAGIALLQFQEVGFMQNQWLEGISQQYLGYVYPKLSVGTLGAGLNLLRVGKFDGFDASGARVDEVSAMDFALTAAYARRLWGAEKPGEGPTLFGGLGLKLVRETLENNSASAYAADLGALYRFPYRNMQVRLGAAAQNLGQPIKYYEQRGSLPASFAVGASLQTLRSWGSPVTVALELKKSVDRGIRMSLGGEYWIFPMLAVRAGYVSNDDLGPGIRGGLGVKFRMLQFDYGFSFMGSFGPAHRAGISFKFGVPPERQGLSLKEMEVQKALTNVKDLIQRGMYLESLLEINKVLEMDRGNKEALELLRQVQDILRRPEAPR